MKNKWRILKIVVTVIFFGFLLHFSLQRFSNAKTKSVQIKILKTNPQVYFIEEAKIHKIVENANPSKKIGNIKVPQLEKQINQISEIDSANVYLNLDGSLHVDIQQKVPVFRLQDKNKEIYISNKAEEFPISKTFSAPVMLVQGEVKKTEYPELISLINKLNQDNFYSKFFIGIYKRKNDYFMLTTQGKYHIELGDLENIDFKLLGFKAFLEKFLIYKNPDMYQKISLKYKNQIVTTLNPYFKGNDSVLSIKSKELERLPEILKKETLTQVSN